MDHTLGCRVKVTSDLGRTGFKNQSLMGVFKEQIGAPWEEDAETRAQGADPGQHF